MKFICTSMLIASLSKRTAAFVSQRAFISKSAVARFAALSGQAEVVLVGCGAPDRGMLS
jgi:hypothetical protein